jgi:hypothetical protein
MSPNLPVQEWDDCVPEIARHEVSEDGLTWRPFDPQRDSQRVLHKRIEFAPIAERPRVG